MIGSTTYRYDVAAQWPPASDLDAAAVATERVWAAVRYPALFDAISSTRHRRTLTIDDHRVDLGRAHPGLTFFGDHHGPRTAMFDNQTIVRTPIVSGFHVSDRTADWDAASAVTASAASIDADVINRVLAILRAAAGVGPQPGAGASAGLMLAWRGPVERPGVDMVWLEDYLSTDRRLDPVDETFIVYPDDIVTVTWEGIVTRSYEEDTTDGLVTHFLGRVDWNIFVMPRHPIQHHPTKGTTHGTP